jgi:hypothetical protein
MCGVGANHTEHGERDARTPTATETATATTHTPAHCRERAQGEGPWLLHYPTAPGVRSTTGHTLRGVRVPQGGGGGRAATHRHMSPSASGAGADLNSTMRAAEGPKAAKDTVGDPSQPLDSLPNPRSSRGHTDTRIWERGADGGRGVGG